MALSRQLAGIIEARSLDTVTSASQCAIEAAGGLYFAFTNALPDTADFDGMPFVTSLPASVYTQIVQQNLMSNNAVLDRLRLTPESILVDFSSFAPDSTPGRIGALLAPLGVVAVALIPVVSADGGLTVLAAYGAEVATLKANLATFAMIGSALAVRLVTMPAETAILPGLSDLQNDILTWVAVGKSNVDIATILNITPRLCAWHLGEIYRKLGVSSRVQASAVVAARRA